MQKKIRSKLDLIYILIRVVIILAMIIYTIVFLTKKEKNNSSDLLFILWQLFLMVIFTFIPKLVEVLFKVRIPNYMKILFIFFCFCHFILGEIVGFYATIKIWDMFLHISTTAIITLLGVSTIYILAQEGKIKLIPLYLLVYPLCFAMTIEVLWEVVEFASDVLFKTNMQRFNNSITGEPFIGQKALLDTMKDLIVDFLSALFVSLVAYIGEKKGKNIFEKWILTRPGE